MLKINGKTFMNLQEAVQWLLDNNALPFQCSADYQANTEIGLGTIVNPTPAKVRIGSLIFFADSKVSTVVGITETGFICSDQYNDLVDDVVYVSNVTIDASGHLIVTLSNSETIDAGLIKQVTGFSINASQHLVVAYNDGSTNDLGAIFSGNVNIAGNFTADSIIENMSGYTFYPASNANATYEYIYAGVCKNGNKVTFVIYAKVTRTGDVLAGALQLGGFKFPLDVYNKLYPAVSNYLSFINAVFAVDDSTKVNLNGIVFKSGDGPSVTCYLANTLTLNTPYYVRIEETFLLSENLAS